MNQKQFSANRLVLGKRSCKKEGCNDFQILSPVHLRDAGQLFWSRLTCPAHKTTGRKQSQQITFLNIYIYSSFYIYLPNKIKKSKSQYFLRWTNNFRFLIRGYINPCLGSYLNILLYILKAVSLISCFWCYWHSGERCWSLWGISHTSESYCLTCRVLC